MAGAIGSALQRASSTPLTPPSARAPRHSFGARPAPLAGSASAGLPLQAVAEPLARAEEGGGGGGREEDGAPPLAWQPRRQPSGTSSSPMHTPQLSREPSSAARSAASALAGQPSAGARAAAPPPPPAAGAGGGVLPPPPGLPQLRTPAAGVRARAPLPFPAHPPRARRRRRKSPRPAPPRPPAGSPRQYEAPTPDGPQPHIDTPRLFWAEGTEGYLAKGTRARGCLARPRRCRAPPRPHNARAGAQTHTAPPPLYSPLPAVRWYSFQFVVEALEVEFEAVLAALGAVITQLSVRLA